MEATVPEAAPMTTGSEADALPCVTGDIVAHGRVVVQDRKRENRRFAREPPVRNIERVPFLLDLELADHAQFLVARYGAPEIVRTGLARSSEGKVG